MEDKETSLLQNSSLESEENDGVFPSSAHENQGHGPKQVHQFYFVKLWPTDPDSVSRVKKAERVIEKMNQEHLRISEKIKEKMSGRDFLIYGFENTKYYYYHMGLRSSMDRKKSIMNDLQVALDELCFAKNASRCVSNKSRFKGELDNHKLNFMMLHGRKRLSEERKVLREINMNEQRDDVNPFSSLDQLKYTINMNCYTNHYQNLLTEIKQFQLQREKAVGNAIVKGKIPSCISLKKAIKDEIKLMCEDALEHRREMMPFRTKLRQNEKELEAIDKVISSLQKKLTEMYQKKAKEYESILGLKKEYDEEITNYHQYCSFMNNVQQLAKKKDIAALDGLSSSEVSKFMLEWNNNKAFREEYEKRVPSVS